MLSKDQVNAYFDGMRGFEDAEGFSLDAKTEELRAIVLRSLSEPPKQGETPRTEQYFRSVAAAFGPDEGVNFCAETWAVMRSKMLAAADELAQKAELEAKLAEAGRDAERYREARRDPHGFVHLLKLMLKDKADGKALDAMMDRIMESRRLAAERKESGNG